MIYTRQLKYLFKRGNIKHFNNIARAARGFNNCDSHAAAGGWQAHRNDVRP
jgi:hypothetical protein